MNEYKEECFKRFENTQKYKNYNTDELIDEIFDLQQELDQYKNNWEELEEWLKNEVERLTKIEQSNNVIFLIGAYTEVLDKIEELKEK